MLEVMFWLSVTIVILLVMLVWVSYLYVREIKKSIEIYALADVANRSNKSKDKQ